MGCPVLLAELAALAEDCGWDGVFCEDYLAFADRLDTYDVWITLGLMASATERVWMSYDPDDVSGLFSEDVASRYYPYGEPIVGRDAVVTSWLGEIASGDASTSDASEPTMPSTFRSRSTVTPLWPPAVRGTANCLAGPSSAPTRTASSFASTAKDAAASSPSTISAAHEWHHRAFGTAR